MEITNNKLWFFWLNNVINAMENKYYLILYIL